MEGQTSPGNPQYQYQSAQWSRLVRRNTLADGLPNLSPALVGSSPIQTQLDLLPILLPQHSSYHQAQLAQYNRLITSGRTSRTPSSPLPPQVSATHVQAVPGSRSSSSGGNTAKNTKASSRGGHGNKESRKSSKGERALITEKEKGAMPSKKLDMANQLAHRPHAQHRNSTLSQQSSSVPSTPHQHARKFSFESREPSPTATHNHSPRSAYSESNVTLPSSRSIPAPRGGCRYETAMAHTKRRMPYSLGSEKLEQLNTADIKSKLSEDEERKLSTDMRELYGRLLPTPESETKREKLVQKLETLFNTEWPGHNIRVHVFGSSGNLLCTDESDVDICITTDWKEMEGVCIIANLLAKNGMERVICVSTAKVPIVKIWDPELKLACDMNVNNTLALENTRMIKTYVQIDPRVRPLAMIIKHWTKRRIVNDAAFGGTLSSYTWICMIINFLQSRNPPVLPSLHQRPHLRLSPPPNTETDSAFADDVDALQDFGKKNKETLGELLFHFFRFYGHDFDYEKLVISVRSGKQISKVEKKWHLTNNNRLCVEEPFNVGRNLGNTADDTSFRGLHMELRRAFDLIAQGKLEECCEQYSYPKEEERVWERPPQKPKPILRSTSQSNRGSSRGGTSRGGRHNNNRNGNGNRRASSGAFDSNSYIPGIAQNLTAQEAWLQRQAQAQLHNDLYATYSVLQAQENSLRLQLYTQSLQAQQNQAYAQAQAQAQNSGTIKPQGTDRHRTNSFDQPPLTAPIRPDMYFYPLQYPATPMYGYQTPSTNPSSPALSSAVPELRRSMHRSSVTNGSGHAGQPNSSLRSHSQPASRSAPSPLNLQGNGIINPGLGIYQHLRQAHGVPIPNFIADENSEPGFENSPLTTPPEDTTPKEYVGYYVNDHPPMNLRRESTFPMAIPSFGDIAQTRRRLSTDQLPQSILDRLKRPSRSPSPLGHDRSYSTGAHSAPITAVPSQQGISSSNLRTLNTQAPMVVNGSTPAHVSIPSWQASVSDGSISEDRTSDTAVGLMEPISQVSGAGSDVSSEQGSAGRSTPRDFRLEGRMDPPLVVNGSTSLKNGVSPVTGLGITDGGVLHSINVPNGLATTEQPNGPPRLSPNTRNRLARQGQNGGMSPLDIGMGQFENLRDDTAHLSPVYETRTPSPTANRKFEPALDRKLNGSTPMATEEKSDPVQIPQRFESTNGTRPKQNLAAPKPNGHTRSSKSEGAGVGGWQKIPKGKKKGTSSEAKTGGVGQIHGEKPPTNGSERKGG